MRIASGQQGDEPDHAPEDRGHQDDRQERPWTEEGPDHGQELHVAQTHAFDAAEQEIEPADEPQKAPPQECADDPAPPGNVEYAGAEEAAQNDARKADFIGNLPVVQVHERRDHQSGDKEPPKGRSPMDAVSCRTGHKEKGGQQLDHRITKGNGAPTLPTSPPEGQPAQDRHVQIPRDWVSTMGTAGAGPDDALAMGASCNHHVQERTDQRTQDGGKQWEGTLAQRHGP